MASLQHNLKRRQSRGSLCAWRRDWEQHHAYTDNQVATFSAVLHGLHFVLCGFLVDGVLWQGAAGYTPLSATVNMVRMGSFVYLLFEFFAVCGTEVEARAWDSQIIQ